MISSDKWERVNELFRAAAELPPSERQQMLDQMCDGDADLKAEVISLLEFDDAEEQFIETPAIALAPEIVANLALENSWAGRRFGPYRIVREVGRGGMGAVYEAVRDDDEYQKRVALKLVKHGMDTDFVLSRFRSERQILAGLDHPNIARLLDGGTTDDGRPYLIMEFVEGAPLTRYCNESNLSVNARLELFRRVCAAVHYAHQNLVIHRDLKPGNVLVTADGTPKLLDFGIAKLLNHDLSPASAATITMLRMMTPEYASPEQIRGEQVTTATDVYSLGILLYQLLTGKRPYLLKEKSPAEAARIVCGREPERPSQAISNSIAETANSQTAFGNAKALRGDLDNIVLMAMRKEPGRRYASVEQFSEDIRRHLEGLPVIARKDTLGYRSVKFAGRHRLGVAAAAMILLALIGGVIATAWQARVAARERDQARIEKVKAERVKDFLQEMLNSADPLKKGSNVKASDLLADAARRADALDNQPQLQAELRRTIGETYSGLGLYAQAEPLLRQAWDSYRRLFGDDHTDTARTLYDLATLMRKQGNLQQAETIFRQTLAIQRKLAPQGDEATAETLFYLGEDLVQAGRTDEAEREITASLAMIRRIAGENHSLVALGQSTQGLIAEYRGDLSGAANLYRQSIATFRRLGPPNALESLVLMNLATNLTSQKKYDEAAATFHEGIDLSRKLFGANHPNEAILLTHYGRMFYLKGDSAKAEELLTSALEIERKAWAPGHPDSAQTLATLGLVMTRAGKAKEAEGHLREALSIREKALPKGHWTTANVKSILGECLTAQRRYAEAAPLLQEGYEEIKTALGENHPRTLEALERLSQIRDARKR